MTFLYPGPGPWSGLFCPTPPTIPAIFQARCVPGTVLNTLSYFASISYEEDLMTLTLQIRKLRYKEVYQPLWNYVAGKWRVRHLDLQTQKPGPTLCHRVPEHSAGLTHRLTGLWIQSQVQLGVPMPTLIALIERAGSLGWLHISL